jgi:hypothetical protein
MDIQISADMLKHKYDMYDRYVKQILQDISIAHKIGKTWIIYAIPYFSVGQPTYDQKKCVEYVCSKLKEAKFKYKIMKHIQPPQIHLFISWFEPTDQTQKRRSVKGDELKEPNSPSPSPKSQKTVTFGALSDLEQTYHAMRLSGKLSHLKNFK